MKDSKLFFPIILLLAFIMSCSNNQNSQLKTYFYLPGKKKIENTVESLENGGIEIRYVEDVGFRMHLDSFYLYQSDIIFYEAFYSPNDSQINELKKRRINKLDFNGKINMEDINSFLMNLKIMYAFELKLKANYGSSTVYKIISSNEIIGNLTMFETGNYTITFFAL